MIVLDTTVLVYAVGENHPFREPCRTLLQAIAADRLPATTTVAVIQALVHVRARRRGAAEAAALGRDYAALLSPLLSVTGDHLRTGLDLYERVDGLGPFDAVLAAASETQGASALVSTDRAFAGVPSLRHVVPDDAGLAELL